MSPPESAGPRTRLDDPDELLDARADPAAAAFGTSGSEAGSELNWIALLTERVQLRALSSDRHRWWVLGSLLAGLLALNFTFTVFIVALPKVAHEFGQRDLTTLTWTMIGPLLAYGLAAPLFGKVGDVFGHRRLYLLGLIGAMVSALATALAPTAGLLIAARALDGIQGAATGTASMALIMSAFPPHERVKAMGWWSLVGAGGPVLGVSIGSPVIQYFGWRSLFWGQLVLLGVAVCVVSVVLPRGRSEAPVERTAAVRAFKEMDWVGSWSLSGSVTALMLGLSLGHDVGWLSPAAWVCWLATLVGISVFVRRIRTSSNPLIPPQYFRRRNFVLPMVLRCSANFAYFAAFFLAPLLMELGYSFSLTKVGLVSIARPLCFAIFSPIAGYAAASVGERTTAVVGTASLCASLALFALMGPSTPLAVLVVALALSGFGMGVAMPGTSSMMANEVSESDFGVMSAAQILAMQVGEVAGIQVVTTIQQGIMHQRGLTTRSSDHAALLATFHVPFLVGTALAGVAVAAAVWLRPVPRTVRAPVPAVEGSAV